jgi:hypothetical protein
VIEPARDARIRSTTLCSVLSQLRLDRETVAEALQRCEQRVDLVERVGAQLRRLERELEVDRVDAVGNLQQELRIAAAATAATCGGVCDEDAANASPYKPGRLRRSLTSTRAIGARDVTESRRRAYCAR